MTTIDDVVKLVNQGATLVRAGRFAEARPFYEQALPLAEQLIGAATPQVGELHANLAGIASHAGDLAASEAHHKKALAAFEASLGPEHPHVAVVLTNLGAVCIQTERHAEAVPLLVRSVTIRVTAGQSDQQIDGTAWNLGLAYKALGRWAEAENVFFDRLKSRSEAHGPLHPSCGDALLELGQACQEQAAHARAEEFFRFAVQVWEKQSDTTTLRRAARGQVTALHELGRHAEADELKRRHGLP